VVGDDRDTALQPGEIAATLDDETRCAGLTRDFLEVGVSTVPKTGHFSKQAWSIPGRVTSMP
jgi:hypothetical protein